MWTKEIVICEYSYTILYWFHDFMFYLDTISSVVSDANTPYIFMLGNYNANINNNGDIRHQFGKELFDFCDNE